MRKIALIACLVLALFIIGCQPGGEAIGGQRYKRAPGNIQPPTGITQPAQVAIQQLTAVINGPTNIQANQLVKYDAYKSTGNIVAYKWTFGDGTIAAGPNVAHSYVTAGTYLITLKVTDNLNTATATLPITVWGTTTQQQAPTRPIQPVLGQQVKCTTTSYCQNLGKGYYACRNGVCI